MSDVCAVATDSLSKYKMKEMRSGKKWLYVNRNREIQKFGAANYWKSGLPL